MRPLLRRRGFTLMELTVTITIICVLAAILFPVFARAREKARQARCQTNLQQICLALGMYARDHAGHFPPNNDDLSPLLGRYLPMAEILECPSASPKPGETETDPSGHPVPPFSYYYRGGYCDDDDPGTLLVCDSNLSRHNEGANALLADGHTKWFKWPRATYPGAYRENPLEVIAKERKLPTDPFTPGGDTP